MYIYTQPHMYIYTRTCTYIPSLTHISIHRNQIHEALFDPSMVKYMYTHTVTHVYTTHTHTYIHTQKLVKPCRQIHVYIHIHTCIHTQSHTHTHTEREAAMVVLHKVGGGAVVNFDHSKK